MKLIRALILFLVAFQASLSSAGDYGNFNYTLARIQRKSWKGNFDLTALGTRCTGTIEIDFYEAQPSRDSLGQLSLAYHHLATFDPSTDLVCSRIAPGLSDVNVEGCDDQAPSRPDRFAEGKNKAFRELMVRDGGRSAIVNSPTCKDGKLEYLTFRLVKADLAPNGESLELGIEIDLPSALSVLPAVKINYHLLRN